MDIQRAIQLLQELAGGTNPLTGEVLPPEDSCNQADIVRALYIVLNAVSNQSGEKREKNQPENSGKPWTPADDALLCRMFDSNTPNREICAYFKRSEGSIAARLVRLGKIQMRDEFRNR